MKRNAIMWAAILIASISWVKTVHAQVEKSWTVSLQSDVRYVVQEKSTKELIPAADIVKNPYLAGRKYRKVILVPIGFSRNENILHVRLSAETNKLKGVAEVDFVWLGYSRDAQVLQDLTKREKVLPFRLESNALYLDVNGFIFKNLDLRIGQQVISWGTADQFNPTSNLNPLDLEDPLMFGEHMGVPAIRMDYSISNDWTATLAWVPIFFPDNLPATAPIGLASPDRIPVLDPKMRWQFAVDRGLGELLANGPTRVTEANLEKPPMNIDNSQVGFRIRGKLFEQDVSLSYFYGRNGMPQPSVSRAFFRSDANYIDTKVNLMYPRMHVAGLSMAGQIPWAKALRRKAPSLKPVGWWFEAAAFFPQKITMGIYQNEFPLVGTGEYDYEGDGTPGGKRPTIVDTTPFLKWTLGFDYSFSQHWYANVQWVHGFPDEFGAGGWLSNLWSKQKGMVVGKSYLDFDYNDDGRDDTNLLSCYGSGDQGRCVHEIVRPRLGDYIVGGVDFKFKNQSMLMRLFFILDMSGTYEQYWKGSADGTTGKRVSVWHNPFSAKGFSAIIYPQFTWAVAEGAELSLGGFLALGKNYSRFGDPAVGSSMVWTRGKFTF